MWFVCGKEKASAPAPVLINGTDEWAHCESWQRLTEKFPKVLNLIKRPDVLNGKVSKKIRLFS